MQLIMPQRSQALLICSLFVWLFSMPILGSYAYDDSVIYRNAYVELNGTPYNDLVFVYFSHIGSLEPIHMHITWALSNIGLSYEIFQSILNGILAYAILRYAADNNQKIYVLFLSILTSYYFFILFFELDRLKLALIFLLWYSHIFKSELWYRHLLVPVMVLTHIQTFIILVALLASKNIPTLSKLLRGKMKPGIIYFLVITVISAIYLAEHITGKIFAYVGNTNIISTSKILIWPAIIYIIKPNLLYSIIVTTPIVTSAIIFGSERINILGYFLTLIIIAAQTDRYFIRNILVLNVYPMLKLAIFIPTFFSTEYLISKL
jgi:hypothetical protein